MVRLFVFRHAKSSWQDDSLDDFQRPLNPRGRKAAPAMGAFMQREGISPDLILCSAANRTRETLAHILSSLDGDIAIHGEEALYLASADSLLSRLKTVEPEKNRVMLIGHNPGLQDLVLLLAGSGSAEDLAQIRGKFPTASLAELTFRKSWSELAPGSGKLVQFATPRALTAESDV